jgi:hypothetical protein
VCVNFLCRVNGSFLSGSVVRRSKNESQDKRREELGEKSTGADGKRNKRI